MVDLQDRVRGCILTAAIGDALGMPTEDISKEVHDSVYHGRVETFEKPVGWHACSDLPAGAYTDDTQQLLLLAQSIADNDGFCVSDFAGKLKQWVTLCRTSPMYNRYPGTTSVQAARLLVKGASYEESGSKTTQSSGSAMRVAPLGVYYHDNDLARVMDVAMASSKITHNSAVSCEAAALVAGMIAQLTCGVEPIEAYEQVRSYAQELREPLGLVFEQRDQHPTKVGQYIGQGSAAREVVPMAFHCFLFARDDPKECLLNAANLVPGDTDTIACIAGSLCGAYHGTQGIPMNWQQGVENALHIISVANRLYAAMLRAH